MEPKMSASGSKRCKVDSKNRAFNPNWTAGFLFIMPSHLNAKPLCLICQTTVAVCKVANLKRHFESKHSNFNTAYSPGSVLRRDKIESLKSSYHTSNLILTTSANVQEKTTAASLWVMWALAKKKKPFLDSELVKECTLELLDKLLAGDKNKDDILNRVKQVPLSDSTAARTVEIIGEDCLSALLSELKNTKYMSLAVDESCDFTDTAQLSLFVRFYDGEIFKEKFLCLIPIETYTTGEIVFEKVKVFFNQHGLDLQKVNLLVTDGASSMTGKAKGFASRLTVIHPSLNTLHCIIHQTVLCAFLCGITGHLNSLNLQLQGRASSVGDLFEKVCAFQRNLEIFNTDLTGKMLHFPTLRVVVATDDTSMKMMQEFTNNLIKNFQMRFENFKIPKDVLLFVRDPFVVCADGPSEAKNIFHSIDEGAFQLEIVRLQSSDVLKAKFREVGPCDFWTQYADQFQNSQNLAIFLLTMFGSTFLCESGISSMNIIKNQHRSRLTNEHLHQCMRLALTSYKPVFTKLARERQCHLSH
ncbi:SCAN domain-containing protein 3 [Acipenser ruthenus]|uniref:SCAN domain-containing protein 3 n=1 Tax=Acipenser ruthenus TaxID=7906 RepID=A0A662YTU8_ACIRT|nr:SCAN domain-containing protein 3 [Acipenser ruthenus]